MPFVSCYQCGYVGPVSDEDYQAVIVAGESFVCTDCEPEYEIEMREIDLPSLLEGVQYKQITFADVKPGDVFLSTATGEWLKVVSIGQSRYSDNGVEIRFGEDHTVSSGKEAPAYILA